MGTPGDGEMGAMGHEKGQVSVSKCGNLGSTVQLVRRKGGRGKGGEDAAMEEQP